MKLSTILIISSLSMGIGTILIGFIGFQSLVNFVVKDQTSLRKRNEIRDIYLKIPFPLDFKIYLFNITNPNEVQNGAKPIVKEVGPYCYDEHKNKINVVDNDAADSLQYDVFDIYYFNQTRSGGLSDEDYVTIINPLLVGMVNKVNADSPALLSIVNQAISSIFRNPQSIYLTDKVKNILFDGMELDCQTTEFAAKAVCTQMKALLPGIKESPKKKGVLLFSLLGTRNSTITDTVTVLRGIKNYKDLGRVLELNGKNQIDLWASDWCNRFHGTDGWIIPPLLDPADGVNAFSNQLCRNIHLNYTNDDIIKGIKVRRYEGNFGDQMNNEEDKCYCPTPKTCLRKGVFDLSKCLGAPIYASLPHYLYADDIFQTQVDGLDPDPEKHVLHINLEPMTSAPLRVKMRIQMSLEIAPNQKITVMKNLPVAMHPLLWLEDGLELEGPLYDKISNIFILLNMAHIIRWIILVGSLGTLAYGYYLYFKNQKVVKITPVHNSSTGNDNPGFTRSTNDLVAKLREEMRDDKPGRNNNIMSGHEFDRYS